MRPGYRPHPLNHSEVIEAHPDVRKLPVRTLAGIMATLGHTGRRIDVLKLDIEGSEFLFLEEIFDTLGCPPIDQLAIEWHHFTHDERYGTSPELNTMLAFLNRCNLRKITPRRVNTPRMWQVYDEEMQRHSRYALDTYVKFDEPGAHPERGICRRERGGVGAW
jgi:hypothetical protein